MSGELFLAGAVVVYWILGVWRIYNPATSPVEKAVWLISASIIFITLLTL